MTYETEFISRSPTIFRSEMPRKPLRCRLGLHWWSSLDWRHSVSASEFTTDRRVERHCLFCGKYETYLMGNRFEPPPGIASPAGEGVTG